ncbi:MAG: LysM peptidoglycan-binding domain-containing protein [Deltaproteobacteria bacterium]|nr:LysM peptidoglycan-binding domain-containing protein [Deltaproteobacteria bacterium]
MARRRPFWVLFSVLSIVVFSNCTTFSPLDIPKDENVAKASELRTFRSLEQKAPIRISEEYSVSHAPLVQGVTGGGGETHPPPDAERLPKQEQIDSALEFCEASNDYWERGDLENAVAALDEAYSLILKVRANGDPDLLQQKEDLRFTISKRIVEVYASRFTVAGGDHNAIPLVMNDHIRRELELFKGRERDFFIKAYSRSGRYRPAIVKALKEAGMPEELSWLPLIESGYKVRALSRARALGMWQFIASTGYRYGLKRDQWIDERMDPDKSTVAAISYLHELHQMFGDWTTALAAYNCGETGVMNRIKTQKINYLDNFWDLYEKLPVETARYVPRLLAVLHIIRDPAAHDMELPPVDDEVETEEVPVHRQVLVKAVAARLGLDPLILQEMNAELRHDATPDAPYALKVPAGRGESLLSVIHEIPTHAPPAYAYRGSNSLIHTVRQGDTLSSISKRYRTSVNAIMSENALKQNTILRVGSKLKLPGRRAKQPAGLAQSSVVRKRNVDEKPIRETLDSDIKKTYTVRGGDNPYLIAKKHEMNLSDFLQLNNLTAECTIFPGQNLAVKGD